MRKNFQLIQWFSLDTFIIIASYLLVYLMLIFLGFNRSTSVLWPLFLWIVPVKIGYYYIFGLYKYIAKSIGFEDLPRLSSLVFTSNLLIGVIFWITDLATIVRPIELFLITLGEWILLGISRVAFRLFPLIIAKATSQRAKSRVMIIGAGLAGEMTVKELNKNSKSNGYPVLFVDDDPQKINRRLLGLPILGPSKNIEYLIDKYHIDEVIVAIANIPIKKLSELLDVIAKTNTPVKRVPTLQEIKSGSAYQVKPVQIADLLNREEIKLDNEAIFNLIKDETVLITGGGGSIGSELTRQIAEMSPKKIIIYDIYENASYDIQMELAHKFSREKKELDLEIVIGSVYNLDRLEPLFKKYQPTLIFHAAAYKHVPLMEESPIEAIRTNVLGTLFVSQLADKFKVKKMILVSSDKAVRPTNIMGATKRVAEKIIQNAQLESSGTVFAAVRFGNVLGSNGSVIPLFKRQIESGGPVTVTDKNVTRYFMTIPESVSLILEAASYANEGEIFVLDMGTPVKIIDLAEKMIRLAGLKPYVDIDIDFIGLRNGEKTFEELIIDESMKETFNAKIFIDANTLKTPFKIDLKINQLDQLDKSKIQSILKEYDVDYSPSKINEK